MNQSSYPTVIEQVLHRLGNVVRIAIAAPFAGADDAEAFFIRSIRETIEMIERETDFKMNRITMDISRSSPTSANEEVEK